MKNIHSDSERRKTSGKFADKNIFKLVYSIVSAKKKNVSGRKRGKVARKRETGDNHSVTAAKQKKNIQALASAGKHQFL